MYSLWLYGVYSYKFWGGMRNKMHKREKLGDNFFSLFSSSSSKYGQRLSILQKKRTYKEVFSSGVWSGKKYVVIWDTWRPLSIYFFNFLSPSRHWYKENSKNLSYFIALLLNKTPLRSVSLGDNFFSD